MDQNQNQKENAEKKISSQEEMRQAFEQGAEKKAEGPEALPQDSEAIKKFLMREVEKMDAIPEFREEAKKEANQIGSLGLKETFEHLLKIAREKNNLMRAIQIAKNMNENILDSFHDFLIDGERYKEFLK